jgi:DNA-binding NarL/FixJ family response regulator
MKLHKTTILVIEDDESMRGTIEALLKKEYRIIQAVNRKEALEKLKENEIQIALIDIRLPDIRGTEILKTIKKERPDIECIMMSVISDAETAAECFKNGALDYFTKEFDYDFFRQRIKIAASLYHKRKQIKHLNRKVQLLKLEIERLKSPLSEKRSTTPIMAVSSDEIDAPFYSVGDDYLLTDREIEILKLKNRGLKNKEMANKLSISPETVKNHISRILHKLNLKSMYQAITFAYERGILKTSREEV